MDNGTYKNIRQKNTFLFEYFMMEGGKISDPQIFNNSFSIWMAMMGIHPKQGALQILEYLDKKHDYNGKN